MNVTPPVALRALMAQDSPPALEPQATRLAVEVGYPVEVLGLDIYMVGYGKLHAGMNAKNKKGTLVAFKGRETDGLLAFVQGRTTPALVKAEIEAHYGRSPGRSQRGYLVVLFAPPRPDGTDQPETVHGVTTITVR